MKVFIYGVLNVHETQRKVWGEQREGWFGSLVDFELCQFPKTTVFYAKRQIGESIAGKLYELTDEQVKATDEFHGDAFTKTWEKDDEHGAFQVYVLATKAKVVPVKRKSKKQRKLERSKA